IAVTAPLVVFLLLFFLVGLILGFATFMPRLYKQRRLVARLKRDLDRLQRARDPEQKAQSEIEAVAAQLPPP
ncbi:MAG: lipopolysaccharide assembly protein LapA domain-containing protein, partial [Lautropia sp.]